MSSKCSHQQWSARLALLMLWWMVGLLTPVQAEGIDDKIVPAGMHGEVPTRLSIPRIGLDSPIMPAGWIEKSDRRVWAVPDNAAGWHLGSARVGETNNLVLSGHNNIGGSIFRHLADLAVGDTVIVSSQAGSRLYTVTTRRILREVLQSDEQRLDNARWIGDFDEERITLVTCYPAWANTHRLIVVAKPDRVISQSHVLAHGLIEE